MKHREYVFRILLPVIHLTMAFLLAVGLLKTIAEGPSPFGFLFYPTFYPALLLIDALLNWLFPGDIGLLVLLLAALLNLAIYFGVGYLLDYLLSRWLD